MTYKESTHTSVLDRIAFNPEVNPVVLVVTRDAVDQVGPIVVHILEGAAVSCDGCKGLR